MIEAGVAASLAGVGEKAAERVRRAVVFGASFIGFEAATSLRARKIEVHDVAPDRRPLERVLGPEFNDFIRDLHERHGVVFDLGQTGTGGRARGRRPRGWRATRR